MAESSKAEKRRRITELNVEEADESSEELNVEKAEESSEDLADVEKRLLLFSIALYLKKLEFSRCFHQFLSEADFQVSYSSDFYFCFGD